MLTASTLRAGAAAAALACASIAASVSVPAPIARGDVRGSAPPAMAGETVRGETVRSETVRGETVPGETTAGASLAVWTGDGWERFWSAARQPERWAAGHPAVLRAAAWREVAEGVELGELRIAGSRSAWRLRVVLVRLDPSRLELGLAAATRDAGLLGAWTVDSMPAFARIAVNAGQFDGGTPWGWHVQDGRELQPPGSGPLAMAFVIDSAGGVAMIRDDELASVRGRGGIRTAFQSYPAVLTDDGVIPAQLLAPGRGVDVTHRDARLGLGMLRDGRLLLALTRFDALGDAAGRVPFGPTTPEMAGLMGALGCARAMLLDGGISAQLAVRGTDGAVHAWRGLRRVPLALIAVPRS